MTMAPAIVVGLAVTLAACGPKVDVENPSPFEEDDPRANRAAPIAETEAPRLEPPPPQARSVLGRDELDRILADGPGKHMRDVGLEPVMDERTGVLRGWEIVRWPHTSIDLRPGDVVLDVNGLVIVRPDDVDSLWKTLASANTIEVRIERDGAETTLHFEVLATGGDRTASP